MLTGIEPRRLYQQAANQIRAMIEQGVLVPGERLPAERELAEKLAVSRPTVREALIVLEVEGLIHIRMGSGVYVARRTSPRVALVGEAAPVGPFELLQARSLIECALVEEATRVAGPQDIARLDELLAQMEHSISDANAALAMDRSFHVTLASIIGNAALARFVGDIFDQRMTPYFEKLASYFEGPDSWRDAMIEHRAIRDGIASGDPARAKEAMRAHLAQSQLRFSESFGEDHGKQDNSGGPKPDRRKRAAI